jgi:hypothetical protein
VYADWRSLFFYISDVLLVSFQVAFVCPLYDVTGVAGEYVNAAFFVFWGSVVRPVICKL